MRRRVVAFLAALLVGSIVAQSSADADRVRAAWGATRRVVVAARRLPAGGLVSGSDVRWMVLPAAGVPDDALAEPPVGRRTTSEVAAGEVLTAPRLARRGGGAVAASTPAGRVAVAVEVPPSGAPVVTGDVVDLWAQPADPMDGAPGAARRVARRAVVVRGGSPSDAGTGAPSGMPVTATAVVVAVTASESGEVAAASLAGPVAVVVVP